MNQRFAPVQTRLFSIVCLGIMLVGIGLALPPLLSRAATSLQQEQRLFLPTIGQASVPFLATVEDGEVFIQFADGSGREAIPELGGSTHIAWSPDGAYIAARPVKFGAIGVRVVRVSDGTQLFEGAYSVSGDLAWRP